MDPTINVISLDPYVLEFIKGNFVTLTLALMFLTGLAAMTKGKKDDKFIAIFTRMFNFVRPGGRKPPDPDDEGKTPDADPALDIRPGGIVYKPPDHKAPRP